MNIKEIEMSDDNIYYWTKELLKKSMSNLILDTLIKITLKQPLIYFPSYVIMATKEIENISFSTLSDTTIKILKDLAQKELGFDLIYKNYEINFLQKNPHSEIGRLHVTVKPPLTPTFQLSRGSNGGFPRLI